MTCFGCDPPTITPDDLSTERETAFSHLSNYHIALQISFEELVTKSASIIIYEAHRAVDVAILILPLMARTDGL
jgi:hypothetical protein